MKSVGVDRVVLLLDFLITPPGLEQCIAGHHVANRVSSTGYKRQLSGEASENKPPSCYVLQSTNDLEKQQWLV